MTKSLNLLFALFIAASLFSCGGSGVVIDEYYEIEEGLWHIDSLAQFDFMIEDTTSEYHITYNVRYARQYPYYNLYISYYLEDSLENPIKSELQNLLLFDQKTGKPLGDGMGDLFDREILIFDRHKFSSMGVHHFKVKQFMRMDELPGVLSFGLKINTAKSD